MSIPTGESREKDIKRLRAQRDKEAQIAADQLDLSMLYNDGNGEFDVKRFFDLIDYMAEVFFGDPLRADVKGAVLGITDFYKEERSFRQPWQKPGEESQTLRTRFGSHSEGSTSSSRSSYTNDLNIKSVLTNDGPQLLRPDLIKAIELRPDIASKVAYMLKLASENPEIDGVMWVNQIWQESRLDENAVGRMTKYGQARGAPQFVPATGAKYGLHTAADFFNFEKSMRASLAYITDLKRTFGNQGLAMAAYNGGSRAVTHLYGKYGEDITLAEWAGDLEAQNARLGEGAERLWRNETLKYIKLADSRFWDAEKIAQAKALTSKLLGQNNIAVSALETTSQKGTPESFKDNAGDVERKPAQGQTTPTSATPQQQPEPPPPAG